MSTALFDEEEAVETVRLPCASAPVAELVDDEEAPVTLRSPESGIVLRPRESQVTFAST